MSGGSDAASSRSSARLQRRLVLLPPAAALVTALVVSVVMIVATQRGPEPSPVARPVPIATPTPTPTPTAKPSVCDTPATEPFRPRRITVQGVARDLKVVALPRDGNNVPGVPPVSNAGKREIAWDRPPGLKPGSPKGNVLINAHTWPDGSALGNKFLAKLDEGDRIIVRGDGATLCYKVDRRIQVNASRDYPPYYDSEGPPQIALLVCSGKRLGPGHWTHRTIWFASPMQA
jgi:hypothetical protein